MTLAAELSARSLLCLLVVLLAAQTAWGQSDAVDLTDRPISEIRIEGLQRVDRQLVINQLRTAVGEPYDAAILSEDVSTLTRLGEFGFITVEVELQADGSVAVIFIVTEQPLITEVQVLGNRVITDQNLLAVAPRPGTKRDAFSIERARQAMARMYRERGHYLASITIDESELAQTGILLFQIVEGPRVRVKAIEFEGNRAFSTKRLHSEVSTRTAIPLFRKGELDEDKIADDVATLDRFYKNLGYLDVRVGHRLDLSPDQAEAKVVFVIVEGRRFTLRSIQTEPAELTVFSREQILGLVEIKLGDVYGEDKIRRSITSIRHAYDELGYILTMRGEPQRGGMGRIDYHDIRAPEGTQVDLVLRIDEAEPFMVQHVDIQGNFLTKDNVIRRQLRGIRPGRPLNRREIDRALGRLRQTRTFNEVTITIQDPDKSNPQMRDILVEVRERNTGSVNFGVAAGSDSGFFGELSLQQRNFDIQDWPESLDEMIKGRAFRGAGQRFSTTLRPGSEFFQYSISFAEPHFLETNNSMSVFASYRDRRFDQYDEERVTLSLGLGRRLGEFWQVGLTNRFERVELDDIDRDAPIDIFEDAGPNNLQTLGLSVTRTTVGTITRPGRGSRLELSLDQTGFTGDLDFTTALAEYTVFLTLQEDFLGRQSILKLSTRAGYIFGGDAPVYEKFYMGGRTFRGFEFRTVSPKGIRADTGELGNDPVGGNWLLFVGAQYEVPLISENLTGVVFLDSGTVTDDVGLDDYRVSIGAGIRIYIPQFGPIPIAFDLGFPIIKQGGDEEQILSFSAELPF